MLWSPQRLIVHEVVHAAAVVFFKRRWEVDLNPDIKHPYTTPEKNFLGQQAAFKENCMALCFQPQSVYALSNWQEFLATEVEKNPLFVKRMTLLSFLSFLQTRMRDSRPGDDSGWNPPGWSQHQFCQQSSFWIHDQQTRRQVGYLYRIWSIQAMIELLILPTLKKNFKRSIYCWCILKMLMHFRCCWLFILVFYYC